MNDRVCVHGAAGSIGSSCVEIISGRHHLILDYGKALEGDAPVPFVFPEDVESRKNYKVFITHSHADHAGYITEIPEDVEVFMHDMTYRALMLQDSGYGKRSYSTVHGYEIIRWNSINIMFVPVNHSAPDACGILIATNEQTILYTGDFRLHGAVLSSYSSIVKEYLKDKNFLREHFNIITEATNVGQENAEQTASIVETALIDRFVEEFRKPGLVVIRMSNQNIERLMTIRSACEKTRRILVTEPYTALCAKELSSYVDSCPLLLYSTASHPYNMYPDGKTWKVFCIPTGKTEKIEEKGQLKQFGGNLKITKEDLLKKSDKIVIIANSQSQEYLQKNKLVNRIIWSMWDGYPEYEKLSKKFDVKHIHSSGHVYERHLHFFIDYLKPEATILVHTEHPEEAANMLCDITKPIIAEVNKEIDFSDNEKTNSLQEKIEQIRVGNAKRLRFKEQELVDYISCNAFESEKPVKIGLMSYLMSGHELVERILVKLSGKDYIACKHEENFSPEIIEELCKKESNLLIYENPLMTPEFIREQILKMVLKGHVNIVFVEVRDEKEVSFELPKLAKELGIKIVEFYFNYK